MQKPDQPGVKPYEAPRLTDYGEVRKITAGNATGVYADDTIQTGEKATFLS